MAPQVGKAYHAIAKCNVELNHHTAAEAALKHAFTSFDADPNCKCQVAEVLESLGELLLAKRDISRALKYLDRCCKIRENLPGVSTFRPLCLKVHHRSRAFFCFLSMCSLTARFSNPLRFD